ncbi:hypothetical protein COH21_013029, partial [Aspergillus flavus]
MHEEQATTDQPRPGPEQSAGGHPRPELMIVDEDHQQDRRENLRRTADEQEARLEQLTRREGDHQETQRSAKTLYFNKRKGSWLLSQRLAQKKVTLEQLEAEERRMIENEPKSVVDQLVARELELRGNIDQLAACLERLQVKIEKATKQLRMSGSPENASHGRDAPMI